MIILGIMCGNCHKKIGAIMAKTNPMPHLENIDAYILCHDCLEDFLSTVPADEIRVVDPKRDPLADVAN